MTNKKIIIPVLLLILFSKALFAQPVLQDVDEKPVFEINYMVYGGTNDSSNPNSYVQGEPFTLAVPTRKNYIFGGWYYDGEDKSKKNIYWDRGIKVEDNYYKEYEGDVVFHARWFWNYNLDNLEKDMVSIIPAGKKVLIEDFADYKMPVNIFGYEISRYEVSQELFSRVMGIDPENPGKNMPVTELTFVDACLFCNELTRLTMGEDECVYKITEYDKESKGTCLRGQYFDGTVEIKNDKKGWRVPNSAEWEFAARGGTCGGWDFDYSGSNKIDDVAWYTDSARGKFQFHSCGTKKPNTAGLYDMSGNASEICLYEDYKTVVRGGTYYIPESQKVSFISVYSYSIGGGNDTGLRLCRSLIK